MLDKGRTLWVRDDSGLLWLCKINKCDRSNNYVIKWLKGKFREESKLKVKRFVYWYTV